MPRDSHVIQNHVCSTRDSTRTVGHKLVRNVVHWAPGGPGWAPWQARGATWAKIGPPLASHGSEMGQDGAARARMASKMARDGSRCSSTGQDGNQDGPATKQNGRPGSFGRKSFITLHQCPHGPLGVTPHVTCVDIVTVFPVDGRLIFSLFVDWDGGGCIWGAEHDFLSTGICQLGSSLLRFVDWARYHPVQQNT